jgi:hypothetical protein
MPNDSDIDVLYNLIDQSSDAYHEFYPKKEGEAALRKWPFLAQLSISGTNRPPAPIQLKTAERTLSVPQVKSVELKEPISRPSEAFSANEVSQPTQTIASPIQNQDTASSSSSVFSQTPFVDPFKSQIQPTVVPSASISANTVSAQRLSDASVNQSEANEELSLGSLFSRVSRSVQTAPSVSENVSENSDVELLSLFKRLDQK